MAEENPDNNTYARMEASRQGQKLIDEGKKENNADKVLAGQAQIAGDAYLAKKGFGQVIPTQSQDTQAADTMVAMADIQEPPANESPKKPWWKLWDRSKSVHPATGQPPTPIRSSSNPPSTKAA